MQVHIKNLIDDVQCDQTVREHPGTGHSWHYIIEIPTPRWTAYDRVKFPLDLPQEIPLKTQGHAYLSPI